MPARDELGDALADPLGELAGGLAGEGEPEHLGHGDVAVREQPDDAVGHRLGLAAARSGDDDALAARVGLDHGALLGGRRVQSEPRGDVGGGRSPVASRRPLVASAHADTAGTRCTRYCQPPNLERYPSSAGPVELAARHRAARPSSSRSRNSASASSSNGCCARSV